MLLVMLVDLVFGVAAFVIDLMPMLNFDANIFHAIGSIANVMNGVAYLLPLDTFAICVAMFFICHNLSLFISIINWIIAKIPGVN